MGNQAKDKRCGNCGNFHDLIHAIDTAEPNTKTSPTDNTSTLHLMATPQLYFHSLYINSVSENDTQALLPLQVDCGQVTAPLLHKIDMGAEGNIIPIDTYKRLCIQLSYSSNGTPLGLTPSSKSITAFEGHTTPHFGACELISRPVKSIVNDPRIKITSLLPPLVSTSYELRRQRRFAIPPVKTNRFGNSFIVKSARKAFK